MPARRTPLPVELNGRLFTRATSRAHGVSRGVLRGPGVQTLVRGVYLGAAREATFGEQLRAQLAVLPPPTAVDSVTALWWWGIEVGSATPFRFVTTATYQSKRSDVRVRRVQQLPDRRGSVVSPVAALVAAKVELGLLDLVVAGDWLIHANKATYDEVRRALTAAAGRNCTRARRAGELVRAKVESPRETRLRLVIVLSGLPEPECNVELGDEWFFIGRVDLYLRAWNIAVEYEGDQHRTDARIFGRDLERQELLLASGVRMVRVSKEHLRKPREVALRIHAALVSRGYRGAQPRFGPEWCDVFE